MHNRHYKTLFTLALVSLSIVCRSQSAEMAEALRYLNAVRANPGAYSSDAGADLSDIEPRPALIWNEQLAAAAKRKAQDMANRDYFDHVDPDGLGMNHHINKAGYTLIDSFLKEPSSNFFESLSAGTDTPRSAIINLISDGNEPIHANAGHRLHLLGMKDFWKNCQDIGIGWVTSPSSRYRTYCVVLIAKHSW